MINNDVITTEVSMGIQVPHSHPRFRCNICYRYQSHKKAAIHTMFPLVPQCSNFLSYPQCVWLCSLEDLKDDFFVVFSSIELFL